MLTTVHELFLAWNCSSSNSHTVPFAFFKYFTESFKAGVFRNKSAISLFSYSLNFKHKIIVTDIGFCSNTVEFRFLTKAT